MGEGPTITEMILGRKLPRRRDFRKRVYARDDWTCRACGWRDPRQTLTRVTIIVRETVRRRTRTKPPDGWRVWDRYTRQPRHPEKSWRERIRKDVPNVVRVRDVELHRVEESSLLRSPGTGVWHRHVRRRGYAEETREYTFRYVASVAPGALTSRVWSGGFLRRWNVDHIVPLVLGGADDMENLQLLCPVCAFFKTERDMHDMMTRLKQAEEKNAAQLTRKANVKRCPQCGGKRTEGVPKAAYDVEGRIVFGCAHLHMWDSESGEEYRPPPLMALRPARVRGFGSG